MTVGPSSRSNAEPPVQPVRVFFGMSMIRDIMTKNVFAIRPETTLAEAVKFLTEHHVGGAPGIGKRRTVGSFSELATLDVVFEEDVRQAHIAQYMDRERGVGHARRAPHPHRATFRAVCISSPAGRRRRKAGRQELSAAGTS